MQIRYSITRWDIFVSSLRAVLFQRSSLMGVFAPGAFLACLSFFGGGAERPMQVRVLAALFVMLVAVALMVAFLTISLGLLVVFRKHRGGLGEHILELADDGLRESTRYNSTLHTWDGLLKVRRSGTYGYIFFTESLAHVVPMEPGRANGDPEEFLKEVQRRMKTAEPGATDNPDDAQRLREDH